MTDASINTHTLQPEASFGDYVALLKPRVMSLVVFTSLIFSFKARSLLKEQPLSRFTSPLCVMMP